MSFSSAGSSLNCKAPLRFHQVREGETVEQIASKYKVDVAKILSENPCVGSQAGNTGTKVPTGEILAFSLQV